VLSGRKIKTFRASHILKARTNLPLQRLVDDWLAWDENSETRQKVAQLAEQAAFPELQRMMAPRLLFGTAGIRGRMGPGFGQLNDLTIIQTTQVLVLTLIQRYRQCCGSGSVSFWASRIH
jgi:phosphoglucomutase/phosphopentomutase